MYFQHIEIPSKAEMDEMYTTNHVLREKGRASLIKDQKKNFMQTIWDEVAKRTAFFSKMNNPLSITVVKDDMVTPEIYGTFTEELLKKNAKSYICPQEEKASNITKQMLNMYDSMQPFITIDRFLDYMKRYPYNQQSHDTIKVQHGCQDATVEETMYSATKCKDTMESHFVSHNCETEQSSNMIDDPCSMKIDLQRCMDSEKDSLDMDTTESKIDEDTFESFLMVSHLDVPPPHATPVKETSMSARLSEMCRKAWYGMTDRFYCRMESTDSSEIPVKRMKQHNRRKANAIATGRGRGRAKCQLRRSGVSQTRHRKERTKHIQDDYETWQIYSVQNECPVDDTDDDYDVPDAAQFINKTTCPIILNFSDIIPTECKLKTCNKQEEAKYPTRVRYVSSIKTNNGYCEDSEMHEKDLSRPRLLSECTDDSEDSFVVFEDSDDEFLEARDEQDASMDYLNEVRCLPKDSWRSNNWMNCNKYDMQNPLRQRLLSESSIDSEDSFCIVFKPQSDYAGDFTIDDCASNETSFRNRDNKSEDDSTIGNESINEDDQVTVASTAYDDQDSEKLTAKTKKVSFDLNPVVHIMVKWDYAYRSARKGPWEEMARDNERFKGRINSIAAVLNPVLTNNHRSQVWQKRFSL